MKTFIFTLLGLAIVVPAYFLIDMQRNPGPTMAVEADEGFKCKVLYKYPKVWQCRHENGSNFLVDLYLTDNGVAVIGEQGNGRLQEVPKDR